MILAPLFVIFLMVLVQRFPLRNKVMQYVGRISFGIYLWHMFVWLLFQNIIMPINIILTVVVTLVVAGIPIHKEQLQKMGVQYYEELLTFIQRRGGEE